MLNKIPNKLSIKINNNLQLLDKLFKNKFLQDTNKSIIMVARAKPSILKNNSLPSNKYLMVIDMKKM